MVDRLVNLSLHEAVRSLEKQEERGSAYPAIEAQVRLFAGWLGIEIGAEGSVWAQFPPQGADVVTLYEAVQRLAGHELEQLETLLTVLAFGQANCERLDTEDSLFNRVAQDLGADMRNHWRPDRAFLERRNREQLAAIAEDSGYALSASAVRSYKKAELVNSLLRHFANAYAAADPTPAQVKALKWLPAPMQFPAIDPETAQEPETDDEQAEAT